MAIEDKPLKPSPFFSPMPRKKSPTRKRVTLFVNPREKKEPPSRLKDKADIQRTELHDLKPASFWT